MSIKPHIKEVVEVGLTVFGASTTRIFLDRIGNRKMSIAIVLLQYTCGTLCGFVASQVSDDLFTKLVSTSVATLLSRDIVSFLVSDEVIALMKQTIVAFFKKILLLFTGK